MIRQIQISLFLSILILVGCSHSPAIPTLGPIAKISAKLYEVEEFDIGIIEKIEIPESEILSFAKLITPAEPCLQIIRGDMHHHIADIFVQHSDGRTTKLIVRWTGQHPAAISLDGQNYYYGTMDEFPDGAIRIVRLLHKYHYQSRKTTP